MAFFYTLVFFCPWALQAACENCGEWDSKSEPGEAAGTWTPTSEALWARWDLTFSPSALIYHIHLLPGNPSEATLALRGQLSRNSCGSQWAAFHRPPAPVVGWQFVSDFSKCPFLSGAAGSGRPRPCCCAKKSLSPDRAEVGTADNGPLRLSRNHYTTEEEAATVLNPISGADGLSGTGCLFLNQQLRIASPY